MVDLGSGAESLSQVHRWAGGTELITSSTC